LWRHVEPIEAAAPSVSRRDLRKLIHEFRGGLISRENVWLDSAAIVAQLS
jgi:hypothetical protein